MKSLLALSLTILGATAQAANPGPQVLTWTDFIDACRNPGKFGGQVAQSSIKVVCSGTEGRWFPDTAAQTAQTSVLQGSTSISAKASSDKYTVTSIVPLSIANETTYTCPVLGYQERSVEVPTDVTCAQITGDGFNVNTFCQTTLAGALEKAEWRDTNRREAPCTSPKAADPQPQVQGKKSKPTSDRTWR